jgi:hypothetical protein
MVHCDHSCSTALVVSDAPLDLVVLLFLAQYRAKGFGSLMVVSYQRVLATVCADREIQLVHVL